MAHVKTLTEAPAEVTPDIEEHPAVRELRATELRVLTDYTLADAIREGSSVTSQKVGGWVEAHEACAMGAGYLAARARGYARD